MLLTTAWIKAAKPGTIWSVENPANSMLWETPEFLDLIRTTGAVLHFLDACAFGSPHKKPTGWLSNDPAFQHMAMPCPGNHKHEQLVGQVWNAEQNKMVWRTKLPAKAVCVLRHLRADSS